MFSRLFRSVQAPRSRALTTEAPCVPVGLQCPWRVTVARPAGVTLSGAIVLPGNSSTPGTDSDPIDAQANPLPVSSAAHSTVRQICRTVGTFAEVHRRR